MERRKFHFYYKGKKYKKLTGVYIDCSLSSENLRTVYFMSASYKGDLCTRVIVYEQDNSVHGGHYMMIPYDEFISRIWMVDSAPTPPTFIGLKENKPPLRTLPGVPLGIAIFAAVIICLFFCKGGLFWCIGASIIFAVWLYRKLQGRVYYTSNRR